MNIAEGLAAGSYIRYSSFTPVKRPAHIVFEESPANFARAAWTSARCNRLLRPISSRITLLRKHMAKPSTTLYLSKLPSKPSSVAVPASDFSSEEGLLRMEESASRDEDRDWEPDQWRRKRIRRTYSSKGQTSAKIKPTRKRQREDHGSVRNSGAPGFALAAINQFVNNNIKDTDKFGRTEHAGAASRNSSTRGKVNPARSFNSDPRACLLSAEKGRPHELRMVYSGLYDSVEQMLRATASSKPRVRVGARSLFGTCLRAVPSWIAGEQEALEEEDPDCVHDVALATLKDLEGFGSCSEGGWRPLREVARAQGIRIIWDAIRDGALPTPVITAIISLCMEERAFEEAETLCSAHLQSLDRYQWKDISSALFAGTESPVQLQVLGSLPIASGRWGSFFSALSQLLKNGTIPVEWLSIESGGSMNDYWTRVLLSIGREDHNCQEALGLLCDTISLSCANAPNDENQPPESKSIDAALTDTISAILAALLSISALNISQVGATLDPSHFSAQAVVILAEESSRSLCRIVESFGSHASTSRSRMCLIALARALLPAISGQDYLCNSLASSFIIPDWTSREINRETLNLFSGFLTTTAKGCERVTGLSAFYFLQKMISRLLDVVNASSLLGGPTFLHKIIVHTAFEHAASIALPEHRLWALEIEERAQRFQSANMSQEMNGGFLGLGLTAADRGYRWEEGICEWIANTPAPKKNPDASMLTKNPIKIATTAGSIPSTTSSPPTMIYGHQANCKCPSSCRHSVSQRSSSPVSCLSSKENESWTDLMLTPQISEPSMCSDTSEDERYERKNISYKLLGRLNRVKLPAASSNTQAGNLNEVDELASQDDSLFVLKKKGGPNSWKMAKEKTLLTQPAASESKYPRSAAYNRSNARFEELQTTGTKKRRRQELCSSEDELGS